MKRISRLVAFALVFAMLLPVVASAAPVLAEDTSEEQVIRLGGDDRYATSVEISGEAFEEADTVVLANGMKYPDALVGGPLATLKNAPILLVHEDEVPQVVLDEIERLGASNAIILGGTAVVSEDVVDELEDLGLEVERLAGEDRYETAKQIGDAVVAETESKTANLVVDNQYPDALSVSAVAGLEGSPIYFTGTNILWEETTDALADWEIENVRIIGGPSAISEDVVEELEELGYNVERFSGDDRYATALKVAGLIENPEKIVIASADALKAHGFADALAGGPLAASLGAPLLLTWSTELNPSVLEYIESNPVAEVYILGGEAAVSKAVFEAVEEALAEEVVEELVVESVSAINGLELQVEFSKPVDKTDVAGNVVLTGDPAPYTFEFGSISDDGKVVTLTTVDDEVIDVTNETLTINPVKSKDFATDELKSEKYVSLFTYEDTVAPFVVKNEGKDDSAEITFNEKLVAPTSGSTGLSVDGVNYTDFTVDSTGKVLTINGLENGKTYNVEIVGAKDTAGNVANPINETVAPVAPDARVDQDVTITASGNKVTLVFAKAVNGETVTFAPAGNAANVVVNLTGTAVDGKVEYSTDGKTVTLDAQALDVLYGVSFINTKVTVSAGDFANNPEGKREVSKDVRLTADLTAPKFVDSVVKNATVGGKTLQLNFDKEVELPTNLDLKITHIGGVRQAEGDKVTVADMTVAYAVDAANKPIKTSLVVNLGTGTVPYDFAVEESYTVEFAGDPAQVEDAYGNEVAKFSTTFTVPKETTAVEDPTANITVVPTVVDNTIKLVFSAPLTNVSAANFTLAGKALPAGTVVEFVTNKTQVEITLPAGSIVTSGNYVLTIANVADAAGNTLKAGEETQIVPLVENVLPTITKAELVSNKMLKVTFSEPVAVTNPGVEVYVGADLEPVEYTAINAGNEVNELNIEITTALDADDLAKAITVKVLEGGVTDANGNVMVKDTVVAVVK